MTRLRTLIAAALVLPAAAAVPLSGRAEGAETVLVESGPFPALHRGDRVRLRLRGGRSIRARFAAATRESLFLAPDEARGPEPALALADVRGFDRRVGSRGHWLAGALLGLAAGAGIGALISTTEDGGRDQWVATTLYGLAGAGGGLVVGSAVGLCIRSDRWAPVSKR